MIKPPMKKMVELLEDIHGLALMMEQQRINAYQKGHAEGEKHCTVCEHREQGGTDEKTIKLVVDAVRQQFPEQKKVIQFIKNIQ